jgi:RNA polymerase sigma-70 factor (ECF subfamily)
MLITDEEAVDEATIVHAAVNGDAAAFAELFRRYYPIMYSYAYRLRPNQADAQDIAQETFIKAARALPRFLPTAPFRHWLYQICTNTARDWLRRHRRQERLVAEAVAWAAREGATRAADYGPAHEALAALPEEMRFAVVLVYLEGLSHAEAAALLGCAETTVSWRIFRAKRKLKSILRRHE